MSSAAVENDPTQVLPEAQVTEGANTQQESPPAAAEGVNDESMLDVVQAALGKTKEEAPASSEPEPASKAPGSEKAEEPLDELTDEELAKYGPRAQKRIRGLVGQIKELSRTQAEIAPKVESFDKIMGFVQEKGLTTQEVDFTFAMMAAVKEAPRLAYDALRPIMIELEKRIGIQLPEDLQQDVNVGLITAERARELSMTRAQAGLATQRATEVTQRTQAAQQAAQHQNFVQNIHGTIANWEQQQAQRDPDWSLKSARAAEKVELALLRGGAQIRSPQDAIALAERVRREVDQEMAQLKPKPRAVSPGVQGGSSSPRSPSAPQSMLDVVMGAVGAR